MFKNITTILAGAAFGLLSLVACDQALEATDAATRDAEALTRGEARLAACIETQCELLDIDGMRLADYTVINGLTHVKVLMVSRTGLDDLADIADMQQLTELHITDTDITDLTGLQNFPKLKVLHFERMPAGVDISPIGQLARLTELALGNLGEGSNASFIKTLRRLERLKIRWVGVDADLSIFQNHPSLRTIDIYGTLPTDQSALLTMRKLESINFYSNVGSFGYRSNATTLNPDVREELELRGVFELIETMIVC
ncbi:MAG: hypothetical protein COB08_005745 [Rhodobacteraceae bacterium]|nr:hypothetical protein [Paracoccaceae bacterium]